MCAAGSKGALPKLSHPRAWGESRETGGVGTLGCPLCGRSGHVDRYCHLHSMPFRPGRPPHLSSGPSSGGPRASDLVLLAPEPPPGGLGS